MSEQAQPQQIKRLVFRIPGIAVLAAVMLAVCATPFAFAAPALLVTYLIPIAVVVWVLVTRTSADADGLVVRQVWGTTTLPWTQLKGLRLSERSGVTAVRADDTEVHLPAVRARHIPALALVSGGRITDPTEVAVPEEQRDEE